MMGFYDFSWLWAPFMAITLALVVLYVLFGPGIDTHNPRATLPPSQQELEFYRQHLHGGKEDSGFIRRPRPNGQSIKLFYRLWVPKHLRNVAESKGVLIVFHGLNSHSGRNHCMSQVLKAGFVVASFDFEGLGRSDGRHGYFSSVHHLVDDALAIIDMVRERYNGRKVFLHGGSLGGLLTLIVLTKMKPGMVDGAVIQCPAVQVHKSSRPHFLVELIGRILVVLAPKLPIAEANRGQNTSPEVAAISEAIQRQDPLFYNGKLRIGTGLAMLEAMEYIQSRLHLVKAPYLLQHGDADVVCNISGSKQLHKRTTSSDKTFLTYPGAAHNLCDEPKPTGEKVINDFVQWLVERS